LPFGEAISLIVAGAQSFCDYLAEAEDIESHVLADSTMAPVAFALACVQAAAERHAMKEDTFKSKRAARERTWAPLCSELGIKSAINGAQCIANLNGWDLTDPATRDKIKRVRGMLGRLTARYAAKKGLEVPRTRRGVSKQNPVGLYLRVPVDGKYTSLHLTPERFRKGIPGKFTDSELKDRFLEALTEECLQDIFQTAVVRRRMRARLS